MASVEVISVVEGPRGPSDETPGDTPGTLVERVHRDAARQQVAAAVALLGSAGFPAVATVRAGHPADTIVTHVITGQPDLVILGTRGLSGLRRRLIGSVSGKVARYAPASVLIARTPGPIRRVLLGYDASPDADEALDLVARLPFRQRPEVTVCTAYQVVEPFTSGIAPTMVVQVLADHHESLRLAAEAAEAASANAAGRLQALGVPAHPRIVQGSAHEQLASVAAVLSADLLVVGSRGLSAVHRFFLGSTSATLVSHPPTNVLVARHAGRATS